MSRHILKTNDIDNDQLNDEIIKIKKTTAPINLHEQLNKIRALFDKYQDLKSFIYSNSNGAYDAPTSLTIFQSCGIALNDCTTFIEVINDKPTYDFVFDLINKDRSFILIGSVDKIKIELTWLIDRDHGLVNCRTLIRDAHGLRIVVFSTFYKYYTDLPQIIEFNDIDRYHWGMLIILDNMPMSCKKEFITKFHNIYNDKEYIDMRALSKDMKYMIKYIPENVLFSSQMYSNKVIYKKNGCYYVYDIVKDDFDEFVRMFNN